MSTKDISQLAKEIKELTRMKEELDAEITALQDSIKAEMLCRGVDELAAGEYKPLRFHSLQKDPCRPVRPVSETDPDKAVFHSLIPCPAPAGFSLVQLRGEVVRKLGRKYPASLIPAVFVGSAFSDTLTAHRPKGRANLPYPLLEISSLINHATDSPPVQPPE